ncbi:MAG: ion transporter [Desulfovibrionaceae bacterium]|nr:ion transporter [Desulfovibrionaceae bacterium]
MATCDFILTPKVQKFILGVIIFNAITLGLETSPAIVKATGPLLCIADQVALWIFVVELICKIIALRFSFFKDPWNIFDFVIVGISFVPAVGWLTVLRSMRVLRVLRLISGIPRLKIIVQSLLLSLPSIGWITLLMLVLFYTFAVMATKLFGAAFPEWFGSIGATFFTLFQVMTLESWAMGIARPVMETFPYAYLFFIPYVLLSAFIVLNVFIAIIIGGMDDARAQQKAEDDKALESELHQELIALKAQMEKVEKLMQIQEEKEKTKLS